ncbi:PEPxxWA-CTERM sorting domain-containing protein [Phenylobacterium sp.]|uniref:PEPxxWA-CTERM sorting domain-containing protein n=1 Tax=Phenylobacterium sp. TaxID=1871053 RepID=UPI0025E80B7C|nr:PEPxxWA-CTERM sorting domain-containing protein [Phenylobacterium sp.]
MMRLRTVSLAAASFAFAVAAMPALAGTTSYSDTTFNVSDYTLGAFKDAAVTVDSYGQTPTGGNPAAALQGTVSSTGTNLQGVLFTALNTTFTYDPTASGAITSLDFALERYANPFVGATQSNVGSYSLRLLAEQAGTLYQATFVFGPFNVPGGDWHALSQTGILASNFFVLDGSNFAGSGAVGGLDYSGGAITFGFAMRGGGLFNVDGSPFTGSATNDLRADNFALTVNSASAAVPEPATWAMMILGLGGVGGTLRARRRRPALI